MAKEEKILTVQCKLKSRDFDDVYRIYLETEKNSDKRIGLITCAVLCAICLFLMILLKNITFLFYAIGCIIIGCSYYLVPANKKFIATNKLLFGEWREIVFYPHSVSTMEIFEKDEAAEMDEDEIAEATTVISTNSLKAYENARGFLFADGKIVNQFLYVPKRELSRQEIAEIHDFAENNCSGGYQLLEGESMLGEEQGTEPEDDDDAPSLTENVCDQYYGAKKLRLYDSEGHRVGVDDEDAETPEESEEDAPEASDSDIADVPEMDIEEVYQDVIAEETEDAEDE